MRFLLLYICVFCILSTSVQAEQRFFTDAPDLPLLEGVTELPGESVSFDKPQGRIIEVLAVVKGTASQKTGDVLHSYSQILPQFGWNKAGKGLFYREGEQLRLKGEQIEGQNYLKITISPR